MSVQFTVLASGSRGNASLIRAGGSGLLIDLGLGAKDLSRRMEEVGAHWDSLSAALLTHTHGDHVSDPNLNALVRHGVPLYCHEGHLNNLSRFRSFVELDRLGLIRCYDDRPFLAPDGKRVEPIMLSHDGGPTYGFRIEARHAPRSRRVALGYLTDTGCWTRTMADALTDVDLLGVEFNHDVQMQRESSRAPYLIARNLGSRGHLSNDQGAALITEVFQRSAPRHLRQVVLLHLSEQCNRPSLALDAARSAIREADRKCKAHAAAQWVPHPHLPIIPARGKLRTSAGFPWEALAAASPDETFSLRAD